MVFAEPFVSRVAARSYARWLWLLSCVALSACTPVLAPTRVNVSIDAQSALRERIAYVDIDIYAGSARDNWDTHLIRRLTPTSAQTGWPLHLPLVRPNASENTYSIIATAKSADDATLTVMRAVSEYREQHTLELALLFDLSCAQLTPACADGLTCEAGHCVDPLIVVGAQPAVDGGVRVIDDTAAAGSGTPHASCDTNHGGCDPLSQCTSMPAQPSCGACPDGFDGDGRSGCTAVLTGLAVTGALLTPDFAADVTDYTLEVGLLGDRWSLTPMAAASAELTIDGEPLGNGATYLPKGVRPDTDSLVLTVSASGHKGRTYRCQVRQGGSQTDTIKASRPGAGDNLGQAIALDGDTLVGGAPNEDSAAKGVNPPSPAADGAKDSGAVYVYAHSGQAWLQQAYVKPSDTAAGQLFGCSVALEANTLAVGAMHDANLGAVYVYERTGDQWRETVKLAAPDAAAVNGEFGQAVTLQGDTLVIGQGGSDNGVSQSGAAYVYTRTATSGWTLKQKLLANPQSIDGWFGSSVTLRGNYLVVGATGEQTGSPSSGAAYVFRTGDSFTQVAVLKPSTATLGGFFGQYTAISGDTIAVSTFNSNAGLTNGIVYVFNRTKDDEFAQQAALQSSNNASGDYFGSGLALAGDDLVVGSSHEGSSAHGVNGDTSGPVLKNSGAAYVFRRSGNAWTQLTHLKLSQPSANDQFGSAVAISGDTIAISAAFDASSVGGIDPGHSDTAAMDSGALYLFH
jgi:trimeric autotransporter adhesin